MCHSSCQASLEGSLGTGSLVTSPLHSDLQNRVLYSLEPFSSLQKSEKLLWSLLCGSAKAVCSNCHIWADFIPADLLFSLVTASFSPCLATPSGPWLVLLSGCSCAAGDGSGVAELQAWPLEAWAAPDLSLLLSFPSGKLQEQQQNC